MSAKGNFENWRQNLLAFHRQQHPFGHLLGAPSPSLFALRLGDRSRDIVARRIAQLREPPRESLLLPEDLLHLRRSLDLSILKIRLYCQVDHSAEHDSCRLLHLLIHQNEVAAASGVRKQGSAEDLAAGLDLHPQSNHLLPCLIHLERNPRDDPTQASGQRFQCRPKTLHLSCHASTSRKIYTELIAIQPNPTLFLSAGEASGDHYGAQIIAELTQRHPSAKFFGLGGREMEAAGQERIIRAEDVAHMGITEVIRHAPRVYGSYRKLVASIKERRPQAAVLIDFPDVNFRLARELKALNIPVVYFVSPQLWAWKRRRLRWVQERVDRMMVIFPFEETFYRNRGVDARFTGHPLAELALPSISREDYAQRYGLDAEKSWIALLPGSRAKEVHLNLATMLEGVAGFGSRYEYLVPVASTLDPVWIRQQAGQVEAARQLGASLHFVPDAREALFHARASVVASGTATVQAAVIGNPFIVVYRVSDLTFKLAKRLVKYPAEVWPSGTPDVHGNLPIAMVNLIAGRTVVPELIQNNFTAPHVAAALLPLLEETPQRAAMLEGLAEVRKRLVSPTGASAIPQVADAVDLLLEDCSDSGGNVPRGRITATSV